MPSKRKTSPTRRPKTYVFPYEALKPIVNISGDGSPVVDPIELVRGAVRSTDPEEIQRIVEMIRNLPTRTDQENILREALRELRLEGSGNEDTRQRLRDLETLLIRLGGVEEEIVRKIDAINERIATLSTPGETLTPDSHREVIEELQRMEKELMEAINEIGGSVSKDVDRKAAETSERITQFIIKLDDLKASMMQEIRSIRGVCADGKEIERLLGESDRRAMDRIQEILTTNVQQLSGASNEDARRIREQMQQSLTSNSKEDIRELIRLENETLERTIEEMKLETRNQIDRIMRSLDKEGSLEELQKKLENQTIEAGKSLREEQSKNQDLTTRLTECRSGVTKKDESIRSLREENSRNKPLIQRLSQELEEAKSSILDLEQKLEASRLASVDRSEIENLEKQLEEANNRLTTQTETLTRERVTETGRLQRELSSKQQQLTSLSEQLEAALRDLKNVSITEEMYNKSLKEYNDKKKALETLERQVAGILRINGREVTGDLTYGSYNVEAIDSYISILKENLAAASSRIAAEKPKPSATSVAPRYAVIRKGNDLIDLIDKEKPDIDYTSEVRGILGDLFAYSRQTMKTQELIRRAVYDNEYVFRTRASLLKTLAPTNVDQYFSEYEVTPVIIQDEDPNDKKELGRFVLVDVFSPFVNPNITTNTNVVVASGVMKVFSYGDAIDLVTSPFEGYLSKSQIASTLKRILLSTGKEIPGEKRILYDIQDLYTVQTFLIDEAKTFVSDLMNRQPGSPLRRESLFALEVRMIMIDAFIKASLEVKNALDVLKSYYGSRDGVEVDQGPKKLISYVRIRADNSIVDPRVSILLNSQIPGEARTKLQVSHQPFVVPTLLVNDSETPYYQHDIYGPFTRVFLPSESNADIAGDVPEMISALNEGKDVCTISIGPSGSGKTSTLLYFRGSAGSLPSKGVIPTMMTRLDQKFVKVKVTGYEMAANYQAGGKDDYWKKYNVFEKPVVFERIETDWLARGLVEVETFSYGSTPDICERDDPYKHVVRTRSQFKDITIGDFLSKLIDVRLNCGTPLNPVSSRSHLFLFLSFVSEEGGSASPTLIVADLAGRERSFDCESEGILELFSMNRYYPTLNQMINDPLGTAPSNPMFDPRRSGKFPKEGIHASLVNKQPVTDVITPLAEYPLLDLFTMLHLDAFFPFIVSTAATKGDGYALDKTGKDISNVFYRLMGRVFSFCLEQNYHEGVMKRIMSIDSQPLELRNLLQRIDNETTLEGLFGVVRYFARTPIAQGANVLSGRSQFDRLGEIKLERQQLKAVLELMPTYLNAILLINYLNNILKDKPAGVCGYRNAEGEFINRSLDEISNLLVLAASTDSQGPRIHPECLPISCSFAGMDCLLPKNVPKGHKESAFSQILKEGTGKSSFKLDNTVFCAFVMLNFSRKQVTDPAPTPVYDSTEPMMNEVVQAFEQVKRTVGSYEPSDANSERKLVEQFKTAYEAFLQAYRREGEIVVAHRGRLDYRGLDPRRMITDTYLKEAVNSSKSNWMAMRANQQIMLNVLQDPIVRGASTQRIMEMDDVVRQIKEFVSFVKLKNQNSSLGVLAFADDLVKRGLQPLSCSTFESRDEVLESQVGWINAQFAT
jgi:hypothetical protein